MSMWHLLTACNASSKGPGNPFWSLWAPRVYDTCKLTQVHTHTHELKNKKSSKGKISFLLWIAIGSPIPDSPAVVGQHY